ncbi:MAG: tyrosine-protein phosphatase [Solirubrobacteraceae bacterium]
MIDLHSHVLPGIDDGPATLEDAVELALAAHAAGARTMLATPHVSPQYPNDRASIDAALARLKVALGSLELRVLPGAELAITRLEELPDGELERLHLGDGPWLLLESPFTLAADVLLPVVKSLRAGGHSVVLAHPERCAGLHRRPELLRELVGMGARTSVTAGALVGRFGREVERFARAMAAEGLIDNVASDAHDLERRPPQVLGALEHAGYGAYAQHLTQAVPEALLAGTEPPLAPEMHAAERPRRSWLRAALSRR